MVRVGLVTSVLGVNGTIIKAQVRSQMQEALNLQSDAYWLHLRLSLGVLSHSICKMGTEPPVC